MAKLECSIGVIVHNEAQNIGHLLEVLTSEEYAEVVVKEIIVVSSASTDETDSIVEDYAKKDSRVLLITEKERKGKSSAINIFIKRATSEILVLESGDTIPDKNTIEKLVIPFKRAKVGMTGGRPSPLNSTKTFSGYAVNLLWRMHHEMALKSPKLGELVVFRKLFKSIPSESAVDEASIEAKIKEQNLDIIYVPDAKVFNRGPEDVVGFVKQRKRIAIGHLWLKKRDNYSVASQNKNLLVSILIEEIKRNPRDLCKIMSVISVELYARLLGSYDFNIRDKNPFTWEIIESTKNLNRKK